jgi:V/A-type H+-transporting ATPase subunit F
MHYFVIGDEFTVLGFSLAGVKGQSVASLEEAQSAFSRAMEDPETGIIIITERIADLIRSRVDELLFSEQFPLVLEIPDRLGPIEDRATLRELVQQAIGIAV